MLISSKCDYAESCGVIEGEPLEIIKNADVVISLGFIYKKFECLKPENLQAQLIVVNNAEDKDADKPEVCLF